MKDNPIIENILSALDKLEKTCGKRKGVPKIIVGSQVAKIIKEQCPEIKIETYNSNNFELFLTKNKKSC